MATQLTSTRVRDESGAGPTREHIAALALIYVQLAVEVVDFVLDDPGRPPREMANVLIGVMLVPSAAQRNWPGQRAIGISQSNGTLGVSVTAPFPELSA